MERVPVVHLFTETWPWAACRARPGMECLFVAPIAAVCEALSSAARIIAVTSRV